MLSRLLSLDLQIRRDADRPEAELQVRDRALGQELAASQQSPLGALSGWVQRIQPAEDAVRVRQIVAAVRSVGLATGVLGLVLGAGAAAAVYSYDGSRPINILPALVLFAVLPVLMLVPLILQFLPRLPGISSLQENLMALGAGLLSGVLRLLPQRQRQLLEETLGQGQSHQRIFAEVHRWTLLGWSQSLSVAFHVGAIAWFLGRVLVTDLSFTWSTTAEFLTAERVHELTRLLSTPWNAWWEGAAPSIEDVRATQYFRLGEGSVAGEAGPAFLGRWWQFLLACMITYGLAPRVLAVAACAFRRNRAMRWAMLHLPGALDALDRLTTTRVRTQARTPEITDDSGPSATAPSLANEQADIQGNRAVVVVNWSRVPVDPEQIEAALSRELGATVHATFNAGAGSSLEEEERAPQQIAASLHTLERTHALVVVLVKSWEPATLEAVDFLQDLRGPLGDGFRIVVAAVRLKDQGDAASLEQWQRRLMTVGDPWLRVIDLPIEALPTSRGSGDE